MIDVDHEDSILRTFIPFVQTCDAVSKYGSTRLYRENSLSTIKYMVLHILDANGGTMTPSEIAQWTFRECHDITTLLKRLERDELIKTGHNEKDRRFVDVTLTDKGRTALSEATPTARGIINQVMKSISESDAVVLERLVNTMRQNVHDGLERALKHKEILGA